MRILYITAHMGGGVGKAISGMAMSCAGNAEQKILLLEEPQKTQYVLTCENNDIDISYRQNKQEIYDAIEWSDVVIINWWHHPVMAQFLADFPNIPCRCILWSHVNGCVYPYLPYSFANKMKALMVTTMYSLENPIWKKCERESIAERVYCVSGMGDFSPQDVACKSEYSNNDSFTVGYVGTINFSKLHKDYFEYSKRLIEIIPNIRFLMVGDYDDTINNIIDRLGIREYFEFTGYVEDVYSYFEKMDVLGYLLCKENYATTENVLLEAMAAGVPVVVYNNKPEQYIIKQDVNGYLVNDYEEYSHIMKQLSADEELRKRIGQSGREHVIQNCSKEKNKEVFLGCIEKTLTQEKELYNFKEIFGNTPYEWFVSCTGADRESFDNFIERSNDDGLDEFFAHCNPIYKEKSKSSINHFHKYFPDDEKLGYFCMKLQSMSGQTPGGKRTMLKNILPLEIPMLIQIFPVYGCNFRCGYCIHGLDKKQHGFISDKTFMDMSLFKKIIDDLKAAGKKIKMLRFAAIGEPLLHKDIAKMVAYAKQADIAQSIDIVTNGSLLTRELSDELIEAGLSRLRISLEGLSEEDYMAHSQARIDFARFVDNIRYFYDHCKETKVYIKIIDYMVQKKEEQQRFYEIFRPLCHTIAIEHLTPTIKEIDYQKISGNGRTDRPQNGEKLLQSSICPQPFYMMQINPDGNVVPCCSMKYPVLLGNLLEKSVQEVWLGEKYNNFRINMLSGVDKASKVCGECTLYRYDMHEEDRLDDDAEKLKIKYADWEGK